MNSDLEPFRGRGLHERFELSEVQVIGGGEALQAELVLEVIGTEAIRDIEREIADAPVVCKKPQMIVVANQVTVGLAGTDLFERPFLAHLENPWGSHEDCQFPIADCQFVLAHHCHRLAITFGVLEFAINGFHAALKRSFELGEIADQHDQFCPRSRRRKEALFFV